MLVSFSIGKYKNDIICDIIPIQNSHLLLGRSWQLDKRVIYDGYKNRYSFKMHGRKITLKPLSPMQVHEDQMRIRRVIEKESENREKNKRVAEHECKRKNIKSEEKNEIREKNERVAKHEYEKKSEVSEEKEIKEKIDEVSL